MRIIHTGDWHLGKNLEGVSRLEEQERFIEDFIHTVEENNIDMVIISGDIYDNSNPPAMAERLFYSALRRICDNGKRIVLAIGGNHDNPDRLSAASPIAYEQGVILLGKPKSVAEVGNCGKHKILDAGEGYFEIEIKGERAIIVALPYPSEKRLNEVLSISIEEEDRQESYSNRVKEIFHRLQEKYREDTINLAVSHLFILGGEESESERPIQLGGSLAVSASALPEKAQYIALGHLHKPQAVKAKTICRYAGSPLQYSKSEVGYSKSFYIIEVKVGEEVKIQEVFCKNYKPIEVWKCESIEEAIEKCEYNSGREAWIYLEIKTDKFISQEDIKTMKSLKKDILEIRPIIIGEEELEDDFYTLKDKSVGEIFKEFYTKQRMVEPSEEVMELFLSIVEQEEGEEYEA